MDNVVVDSSVVIKWFVAERHSTEARSVLEAYRAGSLSLLAPDLLCAEIGNIVWKKHIYQGMDAADAHDVIKAFQSINIALTPAAEHLDDAYQLAITHQRTVYDCLYLALALREKCRFVTADEKLANALKAHHPGILQVADWS